MKKKVNLKFLILINIFIFNQLYGYIDPGSVSVFLQIILASLIGFIAYAKNYITHFIRNLLSKINRPSKKK